MNSLRCKHEGHRFDPVGSFKPTGVVYALARVLLAEVGQPVPESGGSAADLLLTGDYTEQLAAVTGACVCARVFSTCSFLTHCSHKTEKILMSTVCAATSGNHGRALAWGARLFGCRCRIYMGTFSV